MGKSHHLNQYVSTVGGGQITSGDNSLGEGKIGQSETGQARANRFPVTDLQRLRSHSNIQQEGFAVRELGTQNNNNIYAKEESGGLSGKGRPTVYRNFSIQDTISVRGVKSVKAPQPMNNFGEIKSRVTADMVPNQELKRREKEVESGKRSTHRGEQMETGNRKRADVGAEWRRDGAVPQNFVQKNHMRLVYGNRRKGEEKRGEPSFKQSQRVRTGLSNLTKKEAKTDLRTQKMKNLIYSRISFEINIVEDLI